MADPIIVSLQVPLTDTPDNVTQFVAELNQRLGPAADIHAELEVAGEKRLLLLRQVPVPLTM